MKDHLSIKEQVEDILGVNEEIRDFKVGDWVGKKGQCNQLVLGVKLTRDYPLHLGQYLGDMGNHYTHSGLKFVNEHLIKDVPMLSKEEATKIHNRRLKDDK